MEFQLLNKNTYNNRCIYFSSCAWDVPRSLLMREFAQGISCLNEHTATLDQLTSRVSSVAPTLTHHKKTMHAGTKKKQTGSSCLSTQLLSFYLIKMRWCDWWICCLEKERLIKLSSGVHGVPICMTLNYRTICENLQHWPSWSHLLCVFKCLTPREAH